jgi:hypothetical protein
MAFLDVVHMSPEQRSDRRESDEAAFHSVEAYCASGIERSKAITKAAGALGVPRNDVIAGYWRHVRRRGTR